MPGAALELSKSLFKKWGEYIPAKDDEGLVALSAAHYVGNVAVFSHF